MIFTVKRGGAAVANWSRGRSAGRRRAGTAAGNAVMGLSPGARTPPSADTALLTEPVPPATAFSFSCRVARLDFSLLTGVFN